jgi:hypothetical protein
MDPSIGRGDKMTLNTLEDSERRRQEVGGSRKRRRVHITKIYVMGFMGRPGGWHFAGTGLVLT